MNEKHTPEPWEVREVDGLVAICHKSGWILENDIDEQNKIDARRIIACVNACAGLPLSLLEIPGYSIKAELDSLDEQIRLRMAAENILDNYRLEVEKHLKTIREVLEKTGGK